MTYPIVVSAANYVVLAYLDIAFYALFPIFCTMPVSIGGIGLSPFQIGYLISTYVLVSGVGQIFLFARLVDWLGVKKGFVYGIAAFSVQFGSRFPT